MVQPLHNLSTSKIKEKKCTNLRISQKNYTNLENLPPIDLKLYFKHLKLYYAYFLKLINSL